jgi:hypothetical protein
MWTIRGIYDGKTIRPLPGEPLPDVDGEVMVEVFLCIQQQPSFVRWKSALAELRQKRGQNPRLDESIKDLIEDQRER